MKRCFALLLAAALMTLLAACGSDDDNDGGGTDESAIAAVEVPDGELTGDELVEAADAVCEAGFEEFGELGNRGLTNPAIAAELATTAEIQTERAEKIAEIQVGAEDEEAWNAFLEQEKALPVESRKVADAAEADDDAAVGEAFTAQAKVADLRAQTAEAVGLETCGQVAPAVAEETGTEPEDGLSYKEPTNTLDEAAATFQAAAKAGDCEAINAQRSSENAEYDAAGCRGLSDAYGEAKILGSELYGPIGVVEWESAQGQVFTTNFVEEDDGVLRYGGDTINDGVGLRPANEGNDADDTADAVVDAIRDQDSAAFNDLLTLNGSGSFEQKDDESFTAIGETPEGEQLVEDIRADDGAEAKPLGINQAYAFYYVEANGNGYVIGLLHEPGSRDAYRFTLFYSVPTE